MGRERLIFLETLQDTLIFGKKVAATLVPNAILALSGDLGAGKTSFVQGLALGLKIKDAVQSPTFVTLNLYGGKLPLFHFDLYRLKGNDFLKLGYDEYFQKGGVCAIEWPEKIESILPEETLWITFSHLSEGGRIATVGTKKRR
jgi:tRNA threonylcarbamoyladenosine biosynthesis protein TsaE